MDENFSCTEFLAHHGILGQKWGHRRFQNPDGSLTPEGRKRYGSSKSDGIQKSIKKKMAERKAEKAKKAEQRKELSEEEKAARAAKAKEDLKEHLRKHPEKLPKYSRELTKEDAAEIIDNINFDRRLKEVKRQEIRLGMQKIQDVSNDIGTFSNLINNTKNLYNNTADVFNALSDAGVIAGDKYLPKVGVASDLSVRRQTLFKMSPEDVLKNKDKFTTDELNAYQNRKSKEEKIYGYTEEAKAKEAESSKSGNNGNGGNKSKKQLADLADSIKESYENAGVTPPDDDIIETIAQTMSDKTTKQKQSKSQSYSSRNGDVDAVYEEIVQKAEKNTKKEPTYSNKPKTGSDRTYDEDSISGGLDSIFEKNTKKESAPSNKSSSSSSDNSYEAYFTPDELAKIRAAGRGRKSGPQAVRDTMDYLQDTDPSLYNKYMKYKQEENEKLIEDYRKRNS